MHKGDWVEVAGIILSDGFREGAVESFWEAQVVKKYHTRVKIKYPGIVFFSSTLVFIISFLVLILFLKFIFMHVVSFYLFIWEFFLTRSIYKNEHWNQQEQDNLKVPYNEIRLAPSFVFQVFYTTREGERVSRRSRRRVKEYY